MKELYLIRHAKSDRAHSGAEDFQRPLNAKGKRDALRMGKFLAERPGKPVRIYSSPAARAKETAEAIAHEIGFDARKIIYEDKFYAASMTSLLEQIRRFPDGSPDEIIYLTGHNPALTELANYFVPDAIDNIPTCAIFAVGFSMAAWKEATSGKGEIIFYKSP